jgi:hypothetical protein
MGTIVGSDYGGPSIGLALEIKCEKDGNNGTIGVRTSSSLFALLFAFFFTLPPAEYEVVTGNTDSPWRWWSKEEPSMSSMELRMA